MQDGLTCNYQSEISFYIILMFSDCKNLRITLDASVTHFLFIRHTVNTQDKVNYFSITFLICVHSVPEGNVIFILTKD